jgi:hypothetical protein
MQNHVQFSEQRVRYLPPDEVQPLREYQPTSEPGPVKKEDADVNLGAPEYTAKLIKNKKVITDLAHFPRYPRCENCLMLMAKLSFSRCAKCI